jgi:hypothetical protein
MGNFIAPAVKAVGGFFAKEGVKKALVLSAVAGGGGIAANSLMKAKAPQQSPTAPVATREQAQSAPDALLAATRRRRQVASTVQGGQAKRKTLG